MDDGNLQLSNEKLFPSVNKNLNKLYDALLYMNFEIEVVSSSLVKIRKIYTRMRDERELLEKLHSEIDDPCKRACENHRLEVKHIQFEHYGYPEKFCDASIECGIYTLEIDRRIVWSAEEGVRRDAEKEREVPTSTAAKRRRL